MTRRNGPFAGFWICCVGLAICLACAPVARSADAPTPRRVYVLHSGMHTILSDAWKNIFADTMRIELLRRGVPDHDIIVMDNPYPTASWSNMFPYGTLTLFVGSTSPRSSIAYENYLHLNDVLRAHGVRPQDEIVWIGHSAGGQMGLTMVHLACNLAKHPDLAARTQPYHFSMVITLGAPICSLDLPPTVKLRHYYSPDDIVVRITTRLGTGFLQVLGYPLEVNAFPQRLNEADRIRIFCSVQHPNWDIDGRVVDRIVRECTPDCRPVWQSPVLAPGLGMSMLRLVHHGIELGTQITLEDPPMFWTRTQDTE